MACYALSKLLAYNISFISDLINPYSGIIQQIPLVSQHEIDMVKNFDLLNTQASVTAIPPVVAEPLVGSDVGNLITLVALGPVADAGTRVLSSLLRQMRGGLVVPVVQQQEDLFARGIKSISQKQQIELVSSIVNATYNATVIPQRLQQSIWTINNIMGIFSNTPTVIRLTALPSTARLRAQLDTPINLSSVSIVNSIPYNGLVPGFGLVFQTGAQRAILEAELLIRGFTSVDRFQNFEPVLRIVLSWAPANSIGEELAVDICMLLEGQFGGSQFDGNSKESWKQPTTDNLILL